MYIVDWKHELEHFFRAIHPDYDANVDHLLTVFRGYEEALWMFLCSKHHVADVTAALDRKDIPSKTPEAQIRFRVLRFYSRYAPQKLSEVNLIMQKADQAGELHLLMGKLCGRYGPEPQQQELTTRERAVLWFAYYQKLEQLTTIDSLLLAFEGHVSALFHRLHCDLGPEPRIEMCFDHREPRARLQRFFQKYDSAMLFKIDYLLQRHNDDYVRMFGNLQRKYGREPSLEEHQELQRVQDRIGGVSDSTSIVQLMQEAEEEQRKKEQMMARANEIVEAATSAHLMGLRQVSFQRDASLLALRRMISDNDNFTEAQVLKATEAIFKAYNRALTSGAQTLVSRRFGAVKETMEWLCLLDCMFANEKPHSTEITLRTLVSLLDILHRDRVAEIAAAGGVEPFLAGVSKESQANWIQYLITAHGLPKEREIGVRNRRVNHFLFYNPSKTFRDAELFLQKAQRLYPIVDEALTATFGDEPPPPPINLERVKKILLRYAPHRVREIDDVIEAHCMYRDSAEDVVRRICRTYGPELSKVYEAVERLFMDECEERFHVFATESRMREILARRFAAAVDSSSDIYSAIEQRAAREASMKLELQLQKIRQQQQELERLQKAKSFQEQQQKSLAIEEIMKEEEIFRYRFVEDESELWDDIATLASSLLDRWDESKNIELAEPIGRLRIVDCWQMELFPIKKQMLAEENEIIAFLNERNIWRRKWAADEEARDRRIAEYIAEKKEEQERKVQRQESIDIVAAAFSDAREHEMLMKERYAFLNEQATRVLQYNAELERKRREIRQNRSRVVTNVALTRGIHPNCRFHDVNYNVTVDPSMRTQFPVLRPANLDSQLEDKKGEFLDQLAEYLATLFAQYEPAMLGQEKDLLQRYQGRESQMVISLEQKYNVNYWLEKHAREKLVSYLRLRAPRVADQADIILRRFLGQEDAMWKYLTNLYGPPPQFVNNEMKLYVKNRLVRYLRVNAPELLLEVDKLAEQCDDGGEALFRKLTSRYGPESNDATKDLLERKLRSFYKKRGMAQSVLRVPLLAEKYAGHEEVLEKLLRDKFGEGFSAEAPDVDEMSL